MTRSLFFLVLALMLFRPGSLPALENNGPPIAITSPDTATTFAYGTIKSHVLIWNKNQKMLIARITFTDAEMNSGQPNDDEHDFRLPGVTFDEAKGLFFATSAKGEVIPVARLKKVLFFNAIETTPNARVRVIYPRGDVTVILEAISPDDPAMHAPPSDTNPDDTHQVDSNKILN